MFRKKMFVYLTILLIPLMIILGAIIENYQPTPIFEPVNDIMREEEYREIEKTINYNASMLLADPPQTFYEEINEDGKKFSGELELISTQENKVDGSIKAKYRSKLYIVIPDDEK